MGVIVLQKIRAHVGTQSDRQVSSGNANPRVSSDSKHPFVSPLIVSWRKIS